MDLFEAIENRRSVRRFREEAPPSEVIERLVRAAHAAPFGTARDERHFLALGGEAKQRFVAFLERRIEDLMPALREASPRQVLTLARSVLPTVRSAPVIIVVYTELSEGGPLLSLGSVAAAVENLLLAAHAEGLGGCWVTGASYLADDIAQHLGLRPCLQLAGLIPLGYPLRRPVRAPWRPLHLYWRGFPDREETPFTPTTTPEKPQLPASSAPAGKVLLVDDHPAVLDCWGSALRLAGYEVLTCGDPREALDLIREQQPELVVADALLPSLTGYQLCREVHAAVPGLLPILLATSSYTAADEAYALASGADALVDKPVRAQTLLAHVDSLLRTKRLYDEVQAQKEAIAAAHAELQRLEQAQVNLMEMIVHDLRTPLTSIMGGLNLVVDQQFEPKLTREMVEMALSAGNVLLGLINDLLDVSRMESGEQTLSLTDFPLSDIFRQVENLSRGNALERGLELTVTLPEPEILVRGDADFTRRILMNLVGNSLKFTFEGGVTVWAEVESKEGMVAIHVRDTGVGIPPEAQERIFEKFGQVEPAPRGQRRGTGLGLTFVRMAAEAMGGSVRVESEVGKGSTFTVRLPLAQPD